MIRRRILVTLAILAASCGGTAPGGTAAVTQSNPATPSPSPQPEYELWVPDQAETSPTGGGTLYVYRSADLQKGSPTAATTMNLAEAALGVGDGMGKHPHNIGFDQQRTHAVISYVGSGHVQVVRIRDQKIVASIKMSGGAAGAAATHNTAVTPARDAIIVANQGAKKLQRISADFANDAYKVDTAAELDLASLEDAGHPSNNPVMALFSPDGAYAYVPMRGGGAYVVDYKATPMKTIATLTKTDIGPQSCCALFAQDGSIWTTAQGGTTSATTSFNLYQLTGLPSAPVAKRVVGRTGNVESHSLLAVGQYLWVTDRFANTIDVLDVRSGEAVAKVDLASGPLAGRDPAPDILDLAPDGKTAFLTLRGKAPVTSNIKGLDNAVGDVGGFAILKVIDGGRSAEISSFVALPLGAGASTVDPHGLRVRVLPR